MGPVVTLSLVFLAGVFAPFSLPVRVGSSIALGLAVAAALLPRRSAARSWLLVVAIAVAGVSRSDSLRLPVPVTLATDTLRVDGTLVSGCLDDTRGQRCSLMTEGYGLVELRIRQGPCAALAGDRIVLVGTLRPIIPLRNPPYHDRDEAGVLAGRRFRLDASACTVIGRSPDPRNTLRRWAQWARVRIRGALAAALPSVEATRACAILFGDTVSLDPWERDSFRVSGLGHLLAVSGAHVALLLASLGGCLQAAMKRVPWLAVRGLPARVSGLASLPFVGFFILVTGESPSSVRALLTATMAAFTGLAGRRTHGPAMVAGVATLMVAISPALLLDPGWQLSVVASWALQSAPRVEATEVGGWVAGVVRILREGWAASIRVAIAVTPLLAMIAGRVPATATFANVLAAPLGETVLLPATLFCAGCGVLTPTPVTHLVGRLLAPLLDAFFALPIVALRLPFASIPLPMPTPTECVVATFCALGGLAAATNHRLRWAAAGALTLTALEILHLHAVLPRHVLRVTALDVGQGDAVFVDLPDGTGMLVDGGGTLTEMDGSDPGARAVVPWLALHRRRSLAAVVLSHPHPDHAGGLAAVLESTSVAALWDTGQGESLHVQGAYARLMAVAHRHGVRILGPDALCGPPRPFHGAMLQVLAPCPGPIDGDPPNDASFAIRVTYGAASVLLPGDLERTGEARLLRMLAPVSLLKVPHHGSRTSSTDEFLHALRPRVALLSCGHPSPFGHPHPEVVERYRSLGIVLRRTDISGAVSATLHPDGSVE